MANEIKSFFYIQNIFARVGIIPPKPNQKRLFSSKNGLFLIHNAQLFVLMAISGVTSVASFFELALNFYLCTTTMVIITLYILNILQYGGVLKLIEKFERLIEKSKFE